ncbi:MAG: proteasome assembly chaperone 4 [Nitrosarchaeum sp.]
MSSPSGFSQKTVNLETRSFSLKIVKFDNGYFVSVTEGTDKLGSMVVSLSTGPTPITTTIIPSHSESLFLKLIAERISTRMKGIAVVSAFVKKELDPNTAKAIMTEIMDMIQN